MADPDEPDEGWTQESWDAWHNPPCPDETFTISGVSRCVTYGFASGDRVLVNGEECEVLAVGPQGIVVRDEHGISWVVDAVDPLP